LHHRGTAPWSEKTNVSFALKLNDAASEGWRMNRAEDKTASVCLIHPFTADLYYDDLGVERPESTKDFEAAPTIHLMRLIEDESIPLYEVCCLSDEDYMDHLQKKAKGGNA
jgi:hypothetical protein